MKDVFASGLTPATLTLDAFDVSPLLDAALDDKADAPPPIGVYEQLTRSPIIAFLSIDDDVASRLEPSVADINGSLPLPILSPITSALAHSTHRCASARSSRVSNSRLAARFSAFFRQSKPTMSLS